MEFAVSAARWVVGRALGPVTGELLEAWAASKKLGPNIRELKLLLLHAQAMLENAEGRGIRNDALAQLLSQLRDLAYDADDVLDELDYFRIQDELDGTYEAVDDAEEERGLVRGLTLHARHTARAIARKLTCKCNAARSHADVQVPVNDAEQGRCLSVGKLLPCCSPPTVHNGDATGAKANEQHLQAPKLKFVRVEMSKKMSEIVEQLKPVCDAVDRILGPLQPSGHSRNAKTQCIDLEKRPKTTPTIIEPELFGRQNRKKTMADEIMNGKYYDNDLTVLPVVGPGGIGKTTFTQHIYEEVKSHFHISVWICVSQNLNANILAKEIAKQMPRGNNEKENESDQEKIMKRIQSKQFLLVLDDIWTCQEDEWKTLLAPFRKGGTKGNMVIVTTRFPKVAKMVESTDCSIKLERLEHEDSMRLFQACVFDDKKTWEDYPSGLKKVGVDIVKRLKGFPLAIKTVGRLLRNKLTLDRWTRVLESKEWELQSNDDDIMPALKLSYNYLPFHLQQCFSYCALFPEDYKFHRQELINLWIGLGLLGASDQNKKIEDIGLGYLDDLVDNGFFEQDGKEHDNRYVIHDLLHELVTNISSNESLHLNSSDLRSIQIPTSIRHMSIIIDNTYVKDRMTFENHKNDLSSLGKKLKAGNLRTIMLFGECHGSFYKILGDILRDAQSLRVIFLSGASYNVEDLLPNFSKLVHLRYLRIKDSSMCEASLPNCITRFYHLLVLDVQYHIGELGFLREMGNLLKLRHFLVCDDNIHSSIFEVGKLNFLHELWKFEVKREMKGFDLEQIGQLLELRGSLSIYNLEKVEGTKEADDAKLAYINHLDRLVLNWDNSRCSKDPVREGNVLERLKPHNNIRELHIAGHGGSTCPNWLDGDFSIGNLESLHIESINWGTLPLPGKLNMIECQERKGCVTSHDFQNLKSLELVNIPKLKKWHGDGTINLLPHLQNLTVSGCPELLELPLSQSTTSQFQRSVDCFPELRKIKISGCPKLLSFPPIPWTNSLCNVSIEGVDSDFEMLNYIKVEPSKSSLYITGKDAPSSMFWIMLDFNNLTALDVLLITNCPPISLNHLKTLTCLKTLMIHSCAASGRELTQVLSRLPKLSNLKISDCQNVSGLGVAEQRTITTPESSLSPSAKEAAKTLTTRPQQQTGEAEEMEIAAAADDGLLLLPSQIKELEISFCKQLSLDGGGIQGLLSLQSLEIINCPKLLCSSSSSYSPFPTSLQTLNLRYVEGMETLPSPLPKLTSLTIEGCGNLRGGEALWDLLAQGRLTSLYVYYTPNFFLGSEHSCSQVDVQEDVHRSSRRLQKLFTDDFERVLIAPVCHLLSSSLTMLVLCWNGEVECFTKEQEKALRILTSIEDLQIWSCEKLQSLPAGLSQIPTIKALEIRSCPAISLLGNLPNSLQQLVIYDCPSITTLDGTTIRSLPKDRLPTSLREIDVRNCGNEELKRQCRKLQGTIPIVPCRANSDGTFLVANSKGASGVALRNGSGNFLVAATHFYPSLCDATMAEALVCLQAVQLASELGVSKLLIMTSFFQKENGITLKSQNPTKAEQLGMEQASESCLPPLPISLEPKTSTASKATKPYIQNSIPSVGCTICKSNLKITKATACLSIQELRSLYELLEWTYIVLITFFFVKSFYWRRRQLPLPLATVAAIGRWGPIGCRFHWLWHRNPIGPKLPWAALLATIGAQVPLDFPSTAWGQMQEQHSRCFIQGTEAAEVTPLMEPYMLLLSANAESGNMTSIFSSVVDE
uniref:AAA+ ATPase domain-containing protein n=1 Tax=Oryza barthii TaxID=65489 RepID=A0A0D3HUH3_9ORYZ